MTMRSKCEGFTLIELLVVVAIIAILAAIAVPNFLEAQVRSKVSAAKSDLRTLATGLEAYHVDNREYVPGWIEVGNPANQFANQIDVIHTRTSRLKPLTTPIGYITSIPVDPFLIGTENPVGERVYAYWHPKHADGHRLPNGEPGVGFFMTPELFRDIPGENIKYGRYVLTSAGPDRRVEEAAHQNPGAILALYDPTNGTVSIGELWRFGP